MIRRIHFGNRSFWTPHQERVGRQSPRVLAKYISTEVRPLCHTGAHIPGEKVPANFEEVRIDSCTPGQNRRQPKRMALSMESQVLGEPTNSRCSMSAFADR